MRLILTTLLFFCLQASGQQIFHSHNRTVAAAVPNDPTGVSDLVAWYKADAGVHIVSGGVDSWDNQVLGMGPLTAISSVNRPLLSTNKSGMYPAIRFDGVSSIMDAYGENGISIMQDHTYFYVVELISNPPEGIGMFFSSGNSGSFYWGYFDFTHMAAGAGNVPVIDAFSAHTFSAQTSVGMKYYQNNVFLGEPGGNVIGVNPMRVGAWYDGRFKFNGNISEIIIYNKVLSDEERTHVYDYLKAKYNLP